MYIVTDGIIINVRNNNIHEDIRKMDILDEIKLSYFKDENKDDIITEFVCLHDKKYILSD